MSDFDPVALLFILYESMGLWLWPILALALILLVGVVASGWNLLRARRPMKRPVVAALVAGLLVAVALSFAVPVWTLAEAGALNAPIDYALAFLIALAPGATVGALVFMLAATRCARRTVPTA